MPNTKKWSLGVILATIMLLVTGALTPALASAPEVSASVSVASASDNNDENNWPAGCVAADSSTPGEDGYTAPAPCKLDASGTKDDQYYIPNDFRHPQFGF